MKNNSNNKEIKKLKKDIEKICNFLGGKDEKLKNSKKNDLYTKYKKLFSKEFLKYNNKISQDLFDAGHTINDWYSKDKKLAKDYFSKAIKLATEFDQMTELGNSFGISGNITFAKQILNKAKPLAKTFDQKWTLVNKYAQAGLYDIAKKIGAEAINMLEKTSEKKEYTKELDSVTSIF
jgi:hypothetical protein